MRDTKLYIFRNIFLDNEFDTFNRITFSTSHIFVLSVMFNFCFVKYFVVYIILTLLVYFLGLFLFVPRHQKNSTKMEVEKIVQEKTEMQRHYVMVSIGSVHQQLLFDMRSFQQAFACHCCTNNIFL